jgi:hypothetical protein
MAAITLQDAPSIKTTSHLDANAREYQIPVRTNRVTVLIVGQIGAVALDGVDGGSLSADQFPLVADVPFTFRMSVGTGRTGPRSFFVSSAVAATVDVFCELD